MDHIDQGFIDFFGWVQKRGPIFESRIEPAKRVDPLWVHPFCGPHSCPENGRCFLGALAVCEYLLEGGGFRSLWCWIQVRVGSLWLFIEILVSSSVPYHSTISSGGLRRRLVHGQHVMAFGCIYMQVRQIKKVQAGHWSYSVRESKGQFEIGDRIPV